MRTPTISGSRKRMKPGAMVAVALAAAAATVGLVFAIRGVALPEYVDGLVVENRTDYHLRVDISNELGRTWLIVGTVQAGFTKRFERVIDQGEVWLFRFTGQGKAGGEFRFDRPDLEQDDWMLLVPESVTAQLEAEGVQPPP